MSERESAMRVLVVSPYAAWPGHYWQDAASIVEALNTFGTAADLLVPAAPVNSDCSLKRGGLITSGFYRALRKSFYAPGRNVFRLIDMAVCTAQTITRMFTVRYDVIHFIDGQQIAFLLVALLNPRTSFYSLYGEPGTTWFGATGGRWPRAKSRIRQALLWRALRTRRVALVCETSPVRRSWESIAGPDVHVIPYAVESPAVNMSKSEARARLDLPVDSLIVLLFGTHRPGKDYATVIRSLGMISRPVLALFAGAIISNNDPLLLTKDLPPENFRIIDGYVSDTVMAQCFIASDLVILPYEKGYEKGSGVLLEACRYGRPVIASDTGHLKDFVSRFGTGLLYEPENPSDLAAVMTRACEVSCSFDAAISAAAALFSWPHVVKRYQELYKAYLP